MPSAVNRPATASEALDDVPLPDMGDDRVEMDVDEDNNGEEERLDYSHLADDYKERLFVYPTSDPTPSMKGAYAAQKSAKARYDRARLDREETETRLAEKLGRLHNLLRESREREAAAKAALRKKTLQVYEAELGDSNNPNEFNDMLGRLKAFVKKYRGLPPTVEEMEASSSSSKEYTEAHKELAAWLHELKEGDAISSSLHPHHLAALENLGVTFDLTEDDEWHRSLCKFQMYAKQYRENPLLVQSTHGDILRFILEQSTSNFGSSTADDKNHKAMKAWCTKQQKHYAKNGMEDRKEWYDKLIDARFTFDVIVEDEKWNETIEAILEFKSKFGHLHIPSEYSPSGAPPPPSSSSSSDDNTDDDNESPVFHLPKIIQKLRTLLHHDALSPKRLVHLKQSKLYPLLGGDVYDCHVQHCKEGRAARGEAARIKRKFEVLAMMKDRDPTVPKKRVPVPRGTLQNWNAKLEKIVAQKNSGGSVIDIQNDVKLRGWVFSLIRKLAINSGSLRGKKMKLIESHEGLKELLLRSDHVKAAKEEHEERKEEMAAAAVKKKKKRKRMEEGGEGAEEEDDDDVDGEEDGGTKEANNNNNLEELAEDVLLGEKEDDEVNAFMESDLV
mmetsp:Transcript_302/g.581  ORF Transcript_302/g.581 Transcript_302/m.581 type:complete len:616 (+) Transcript_302:403-2250(+)|eukprot:CAMPEP_0183707592 /NCGR_PEP_ID=MMETSP0737-20130205/4125_1 /TAXON_ID=385413 /ORGANISM="Thalassiosira miniscula, Strain CCMP1093" /LENGTH=615 /DNA_ID=CAMNT_0025935305 /DNA_START=1371 /DNA_END=3218 /DNA_ORIENTATION=+